MKQCLNILSLLQPLKTTFYDNTASVALDEPICVISAITMNIHIVEGSFCPQPKLGGI